MRASLKAKASVLQAAAGGAVEDEEVEVSAAVLKLNRGYTRVRGKPTEEPSELAFEVGCHGKRRRKMTKHKLTAAQLQKIAKLVLEDGVSQVEVAELCNVKPALVRNLVKTVRLAKHSFSALTTYRDARRLRHDQLKQHVTEYIERGQHVWTARQVKAHLLDT